MLILDTQKQWIATFSHIQAASVRKKYLLGPFRKGQLFIKIPSKSKNVHLAHTLYSWLLLENYYWTSLSLIFL